MRILKLILILLVFSTLPAISWGDSLKQVNCFKEVSMKFKIIEKKDFYGAQSVPHSLEYDHVTRELAVSVAKLIANRLPSYLSEAIRGFVQFTLPLEGGNTTVYLFYFNGVVNADVCLDGAGNAPSSNREGERLG